MLATLVAAAVLAVPLAGFGAPQAAQANEGPVPNIELESLNYNDDTVTAVISVGNTGTSAFDFRVPGVRIYPLNEQGGVSDAPLVDYDTEIDFDTVTVLPGQLVQTAIQTDTPERLVDDRWGALSFVANVTTDRGYTYRFESVQVFTFFREVQYPDEQVALTSLGLIGYPHDEL